MRSCSRRAVRCGPAFAQPVRFESVCGYVDMPPDYVHGIERGSGSYLNSPFGHRVGIVYGPLHLRCHVVREDYVRNACVGNGCVDGGVVSTGDGHLVSTTDANGATLATSRRKLPLPSEKRLDRSASETPKLLHLSIW